VEIKARISDTSPAEIKARISDTSPEKGVINSTG